MSTSTKPDPFEGVPKPETIKAAIKRFVKGRGREHDRGKSELRACINFYRRMPERQRLVRFLEHVWKSYS